MIKAGINQLETVDRRRYVAREMRGRRLVRTGPTANPETPGGIEECIACPFEKSVIWQIDARPPSIFKPGSIDLLFPLALRMLKIGEDDFLFSRQGQAGIRSKNKVRPCRVTTHQLDICLGRQLFEEPVPLCDREFGRNQAYLVLHPGIDFVIDRKCFWGAHHQSFWNKGFLFEHIGRATLSNTAICVYQKLCALSLTQHATNFLAGQYDQGILD
jgi:hypothetical protein